jgi:hypothetical protein
LLLFFIPGVRIVQINILSLLSICDAPTFPLAKGGKLT